VHLKKQRAQGGEARSEEGEGMAVGLISRKEKKAAKKERKNSHPRELLRGIEGIGAWKKE